MTQDPVDSYLAAKHKRRLFGLAGGAVLLVLAIVIPLLLAKPDVEPAKQVAETTGVLVELNQMTESSIFSPGGLDNTLSGESHQPADAAPPPVNKEIADALGGLIVGEAGPSGSRAGHPPLAESFLGYRIGATLPAAATFEQQVPGGLRRYSLPDDQSGAVIDGIPIGTVYLDSDDGKTLRGVYLVTGAPRSLRDALGEEFGAPYLDNERMTAWRDGNRMLIYRRKELAAAVAYTPFE